MSLLLRNLLLPMGVLLLVACGEKNTPPAPAPASPAPASTALAVKTPTTQGTIAVRISPEEPTAADCLQIILKGQPATSRISWQVNGQPARGSEPGKLCGAFKRGDQVTVQVGTLDAGGSATVTIGNSPPTVTGISANPKELFAGMAVEVFPVAEDKDGDPVEFRYQWLVNGEADPVLTDARLPGDRVVKGTKIQLKITPYDGKDEGPVYQSFTMPIPNAPPQIVSQPPQQFEALEYSYQIKASDRDGDKLTYSLAKNPAGMTINPVTGLIAWSLTGVKAGAYPLRIVVRDPDGAEAFQEYTLTLGPPVPAGTTKP